MKYAWINGQRRTLRSESGMNTFTIVQQLWNYCKVLHDDGMSYGDYVKQFPYLLFLKMTRENLVERRLDSGTCR